MSGDDSLGIGSLANVSRRELLQAAGLVGLGAAGADGIGAFALPRNGDAIAAVGPAMDTGGCGGLSPPDEPIWVVENSRYASTDGRHSDNAIAHGLTDSNIPGPIRLSYTQLVRYLGATWNASDSRWEHELTIASLGVASRWATSNAVDPSKQPCPPVGADNPQSAPCLDGTDTSGQCLGPEPVRGFGGDNAIEIALGDSNFGHVEAKYQSDQLQFWNHAPFLADGQPLDGADADACLGTRYAHPTIFEPLWTDGWDATPDPGAFLPEYLDRKSNLEGEVQPEGDGGGDLAYELGLMLAGFLARAAGASTGGAAVTALEVGKLVVDLLRAAQPEPVPDPSPNEAFHEEISLDTEAPIVGHYAGVTIPTPPQSADAPDQTNVDITSRVRAANAQTNVTTTVELRTAPEPRRTAGFDWVFDDDMFRRNASTPGVDAASNALVENNVAGPAPTVSRADGNPVPAQVAVDEPLELSASVQSSGRSEPTSYAWLWIMEQPDETPQIGRFCSNDTSTVQNLVLPATDFQKPGTLNVWFLTRDQTGLWADVYRQIRVADSDSGGGQTPTPTPTPEPDQSNFQVAVSAPDELAADQPIPLTATITNTGEKSDTQTVEIRADLGDLDGEAVLRSETVTLAPGEQTTISPPEDKPSKGSGTLDYIVETEDDKVTGSINITGPTATFQVSVPTDLGPVTVGDSLTFDATVENTGDQSGSATVTLATDGGSQLDSADTGSISSGGTTTVSLTVPGDQTGSPQTLTLVVETEHDSARTTVQVEEDSPADLQIRDVQPPDSNVTVGEAVHIDVAIENTGGEVAHPTVRLLSNTGIKQGEELDSIDAPSVAPGEQTSTLVTVPPEAIPDPQTYEFIIEANDASVTESIEVLPGPSTFEIMDVEAPEKSAVDTSFDVHVTVENTGGESGSTTVELTEPPVGFQVVGDSTDTLAPGERTTITLTVPAATNGGKILMDYHVSTPDDSVKESTEIVAPANFQVMNIKAPDTVTQLGINIGSVDVTAEVKNTGGMEDEQTVDLVAPNSSLTRQHDLKNINLGPSEQQTVTLRVKSLLVGERKLVVKTDDDSGSVQIQVDSANLDIM